MTIVKNALAMDSSPSADPVKKYSISFPIAELGNCNSLGECKTYCDDSSHLDACIAFAKEKGFYKAPAPDPSKEAALKAASSELGCNSMDECKTFCSKSENIDKCQSFAQKHRLGPPPTPKLASDSARINRTLEEAKSILGCSSIEECKAFCSQEQNHQKCEDFAKQVASQMQKPPQANYSPYPTPGLFTPKPSPYGSPYTGKLNSIATFQAYCASHPHGCLKGQPVFPKVATDNPEQFCQQNPDQCYIYPLPTPNPTTNP